MLVDNRRLYRIAKHRAKTKFHLAQKRKMHTLAKSSPKKFWSEIRKFRRNSNRTNISKEEFLNHFKTLFSDSDIFVDDDVENFVNNNDDTFTEVDILDEDISLNELYKAISLLKCNKSGGNDKLIPEIFIHCKEILSPVLCKLFNYIYASGVYPSSWSKAIIVPVPKKGNLDDVNN